MFAINQNFDGSLGRNFADNWFVTIRKFVGMRIRG